MAGHVITPFRKINNAQKDELGITYSVCTANFIYDNQESELKLSTDGGSTENSYVIDAVRNWVPSLCKSSFSQTLLINTWALKKLFEGDEFVANTDAVLGIAACWSLSKSHISGCIPLPIEIKYDDFGKNTLDSISVESILDFAPGLLSGILTIQYELFLKTPSRKKSFGIATVAGTRLGEITDPLVVCIDGDGSTFPVITIEKKGYPLWWVDTDDIDDPLSDPMDEEHVRLVINTLHKDYNKLFGKNVMHDTPLFREIMASALEALFRCLYFDDSSFADKMNRISEAEEGSIALCVDFMKKSMNIQTDLPKNLHISVRRAVENRMLGGAVE